MTDVACFCGCYFSFDGGAAACPRCGEVASVTAAPSAPTFVRLLIADPVAPSAPKSRSANRCAFVAPSSRCVLRAIAGAAASGRGCDHSEGSAAFFGVLDFPVPWPVIAVGEATMILLIVGFPRLRV
jgi:hypothetical protein